MLEEKTQDLMINMGALLPPIVTNALNALGAIVILLIGLWLHTNLALTRAKCNRGDIQFGRREHSAGSGST